MLSSDRVLAPAALTGWKSGTQVNKVDHLIFRVLYANLIGGLRIFHSCISGRTQEDLAALCAWPCIFLGTNFPEDIVLTIILNVVE